VRALEGRAKLLTDRDSSLRLKWSLQHLIGLGVLFDGVSRSGQQTGAGIGA
jgi:hypothetical protein